MNQKELQFVQWVPASLDKVFAFFSEAANLERLTPSWLQFKILSQSTPEIQKGTLIVYQLKVHGIPMKWQSLIEDWTPQNQFVDVQLKGPYKQWHHTHLFEAKDGGVLVTDRIRYEVPCGLIGNWLGGKFVRKDIESIFRHRQEVITQIFGR